MPLSVACKNFVKEICLPDPVVFPPEGGQLVWQDFGAPGRAANTGADRAERRRIDQREFNDLVAVDDRVFSGSLCWIDGRDPEQYVAEVAIRV